MSSLPSTYEPQTLRDNTARLQRLTAATRPQWGKMNAGQMLAHLNVAYDIETGTQPVKTNFVLRWFLSKFVKDQVVGPKPYPKNGRTAPVFKITDERDFTRERDKLIGHLRRVSDNGASYYAGKDNPSFGKLTAEEWSTLFQKHLDHHLRQFGV